MNETQKLVFSRKFTKEGKIGKEIRTTGKTVTGQSGKMSTMNVSLLLTVL